jgi:2-iminobutanoate/2-iminopropanoate deaminase
VSGREEISLLTRPVLSHAADAVRAGGLLFVAGVLPVDGGGMLVGGADVAEQARHVLAELGGILAAGGCSYGDVVAVSAYLTDVGDRPQLDGPLRSAFGSARPAATVVEVRRLAVPDARVEIDAVAVVP